MAISHLATDHVLFYSGEWDRAQVVTGDRHAIAVNRRMQGIYDCAIALIRLEAADRPVEDLVHIRQGTELFWSDAPVEPPYCCGPIIAPFITLTFVDKALCEEVEKLIECMPERIKY